MKQALKASLQNAAFRAGYAVMPTGDRQRAEELIRKFKPALGKAELIRLGPSHDGGYLVPDDLADIRACISPGVSTEVGFDLAVAEKGIDVHLLDASVEGPPCQHARFHFAKKFVDTFTSDSTTTLNDEASRCPPGDLLLQMDIEGAEYRVLANATAETLTRFRIMVLELHDLHHMFASSRIGDFEAAVHRLLESHVIVHVHPNNYTPVARYGRVQVPHVLEVTLHRRDRFTAVPGNPPLPHPLDMDCDPAARPIPIPAVWL